jgi:hypothetical protein
MRFFLESGRCLSTCTGEECESCNVRDPIYCHFRPRQLIGFFVITLLLFAIGGTCLFLFSPWVLLGFVALCIAFFGFIEIRVLCAHCPHYAEPGLKTLKCWANYGSPKVWKYRPGPMNRLEKRVFIVGATIIFLYPFSTIFLLKSTAWMITLATAYLALMINWYVVMRRFYCPKCMNFSCPLNRVGGEAREKFLAIIRLYAPLGRKAKTGNGISSDKPD